MGMLALTWTRNGRRENRLAGRCRIASIANRSSSSSTGACSGARSNAGMATTRRRQAAVAHLSYGSDGRGRGSMCWGAGGDLPFSPRGPGGSWHRKPGGGRVRPATAFHSGCVFVRICCFGMVFWFGRFGLSFGCTFVVYILFWFIFCCVSLHFYCNCSVFFVFLHCFVFLLYFYCNCCVFLYLLYFLHHFVVFPLLLYFCCIFTVFQLHVAPTLVFTVFLPYFYCMLYFCLCFACICGLYFAVFLLYFYCASTVFFIVFAVFLLYFYCIFIAFYCARCIFCIFRTLCTPSHSFVSRCISWIIFYFALPFSPISLFYIFHFTLRPLPLH